MTKLPFPSRSGVLRMLWLFASAVAGTACLLIASSAFAQQPFKTPEEAAAALIEATRAGAPALIMRVLGPGSGDVVLSGDAVADADARKRVLEAYENKHQLLMEGADKAVLVLGQNEWPFPIPIVQKNGTWRFDAVAGRREILARRIGRNELSTIQTCLAYVDAQQEYAEKGYGGNGAYARRLVSSPGKKDGLYWPEQPGEDDSPLGELAASAAAEGYRTGLERRPYHGYYYKILTQQGASAPGGALEYVVRGEMVGGFALVAYPAQYGNSGVMTFVVNHRGVIFEKDLGRRTTATASGMTSFNPDHTWRQVADAVHSASGPR